MDRRTKGFGILALAGWAAFFASLAWRGEPSDGSPVIDQEVRSGARTAVHTVSASERRTSGAPAASAADARAVVDSSSSAPVPDTLESLLAKIEEIEESGQGHMFRYLVRLSELGTPDAEAALLELFADPEFFRAHQRSSAFATALRDIEDPRIGPLASAYLDECIENGLYSEAGGYVELIATKHGEAGKQRVIELMKRGSGLQGQALDQIGRMNDPLLVPQLFQVVRDQDFFADQVFSGMAEWDNDEVRLLFREMATEAGLRTEASRAAMKAFGQSLTPNELNGALSDYWAAPDESGRRVMLSCLRGATKSERLAASELRAQSFTVVQDALASTHSGLQQDALYLIEYNEEFQTPEYLSLVEDVANDPSLPEQRRKDARSILIKARR